MTIIEAIQNRHSVRSYTDKKIEGDILVALRSEIEACNAESGLNIQLATDEPKAFSNFMAHYGKFTGVQNYVALIGKKSPRLDEKAGYFGERIVLKAQTLGLNTCWVALTFSKTKSKCVVSKDEKFICVIAMGYGTTQGVPHKSKPMESLCKVNGNMPDWFRNGMEAALLAPTAINQQKFLFTVSNNMVKAEVTGGIKSKIDLGIAKYHFEMGAGAENFKWVNSL